MDAGVAHMFQRLQPVPVGARGNDLLVELRRGIEIVVVEIEARCFEALRLIGGQHSERSAGLDPHALTPSTMARTASRSRSFGSRHAAPMQKRLARRLRGARFVEHCVKRHQFFGTHAGIVTRALRTIGAVFRTAAVLIDSSVEICTGPDSNGRGARSGRETSGQGRQTEQRAHLRAGPIVADGSATARGLSPLTPTLSPLGRGNSPRVLRLCHNHASPCSLRNCSLDRLKSKSGIRLGLERGAYSYENAGPEVARNQ